MPMWSKIKSMFYQLVMTLKPLIKTLVLSVICMTVVVVDRVLAQEAVVQPSINTGTPVQVPAMPGQLNVEMRPDDQFDASFETDRWERYVRRFRRAHNVAFTSGYDKGVLNVGKFGDVTGKEVASSGIDVSFQYSYHAQMFHKFGYYLGSSGGYYGELTKRGSRDVGPSSAWKLPGVVGGLVYCFDPRWRMMLGIDAYLSRYTKIISKENDEDISISMSSETVDMLFSLDYFVSLNWGIRSTVYDRKNWLPRPLDSEIYPTNAKLSRKSRGATVGMVFHFL